ncbi:MAG: PAS domain S-box protein [Thermaurantimonas sp.]
MNLNIRLSAKIYILIATAITISLAQYYFYNRGQERQELLQKFFIITSRFKNETAELKYLLLRAAHDGNSELVIKRYNEILKTIGFSLDLYKNADVDFSKKEFVLEQFRQIDSIVQISYENYLNASKTSDAELFRIIDQIESSLKVISGLIVEMVSYTDQQLKINERVNFAFSASSVLITIIILIVIIVPQVSQLENLNLELSSANALRESIQNSSPNSILYIRNQEICIFNKKASEIMHVLTGNEIKTGDVLGKKFISEEIAAEFDKGIKETLKGNLYYGYFTCDINAEKQYYKVLFYPVYDERFKSYGTSIIFSNITNEILTRQRIEKSEKYFKTIIDNSHGIIFTLRDDFSIKFASHLVEKYLKTNPKDLEGASFLSLVKNSDRTKVESFLSRIISTSIEKDNSVQFGLNTKQEDHIFLGKCGIIQLDETRELLLLCIDITSQVQYEQRLHQQNEKLREIAWLQSHVIRRPVANALGICELLLSDDTMIESLENFDKNEFLRLLYKEITLIDEAIHQINEKTREL